MAEEEEKEEEASVGDFVANNWFRILYYTIASCCLLMPLCFVGQLLRAKCCGE